MEPRLIDAHCHLDLMAYPNTVADETAAIGLGVFDCRVDPRDFAAAKKRASRYPNIIAGIGLHPWWLVDGRCGTAEVGLLCKFASRERFIGEVGLDFSPRFTGTEGMQTQVFERLCQTLSQRPLPDRVLSIHAVRAAGIALDILKSHELLTPSPNSPAIIFHWFSGTSNEFVHARNAGCYFSVNERMLASKRGREYARQTPIARLLLETDAPPGLDAPYSADALETSLSGALATLADIRHQSPDKLAHAIAATGARLLGLS